MIILSLLLFGLLFGLNRAEEAVTIPADKSGKKIAFLFMARGPTPLEDIWREFFNWKTDPDHYLVKIHVHKGYKIPTSSFFHGKDLSDDERASGAASTLGAGKLWGNMAQVEGIKRLVRSALKDPDVEWFTLMSESCIPLHNFQTMRKALLNFDKSIVNGCDFGLGAMEGDTRWRSSLDDIGFQKQHWRKSGTWFALKRKHAEIFVNENKFETGFTGVPCVDEHYLPSILAAAGQDNETTCTDGFAHVHWPSLMAMHPHTYSGDEITPELFQHLANPVGGAKGKGFAMGCSGVPNLCHFTARKFSPASVPNLLENMDLILSDDNEQYDGNPWQYYQDKFRRNISAVPWSFHREFYYIDNGYLREVVDEDTLHALHYEGEYTHHNDAKDKANQEITFHPSANHTKSSQILSPLDLVAFPMGEKLPSRKDGQLIKAPKNNWVFLIKEGKRHGIPNMDTLASLGKSLSDVQIWKPSDIEMVVMGDPVPDVNIKHTTINNQPNHKYDRRKKHGRKEMGTDSKGLGEHGLGEHGVTGKKHAKHREESGTVEQVLGAVDGTSTTATTATTSDGDKKEAEKEKEKEGVPLKLLNPSATKGESTSIYGSITNLSWLYESEATLNDDIYENRGNYNRMGSGHPTDPGMETGRFRKIILGRNRYFTFPDFMMDIWKKVWKWEKSNGVEKEKAKEGGKEVVIDN